jgi:predicted nucleic acid-binding protein
VTKSSEHSPVVVDANIAVWAVLPMAESDSATELFISWGLAGRPIYAPALWLSECISAIRQYIYVGAIEPKVGNETIAGLFELEVETIEPTEVRCRNALNWADKLGQSKAYDGFYVALADELGGQLYTGDRRLASGARQAGADWVEYVMGKR